MADAGLPLESWEKGLVVAALMVIVQDRRHRGGPTAPDRPPSERRRALFADDNLKREHLSAG